MLKYLKPLISVINREIDWISGKFVYWFLTLIGPLTGFALVIGIFYNGVVRELPVGIVDYDQSKTSRQVIRMIDATSIANITEKPANIEDASNMLYNGQIQAIISISPDFEQNILKNYSPEVIIYINNANILKGGALKAGILKAISTFQTGIKVHTAMKKGENYHQAMSNAVPVNFDTHILFNPYTNYFYYLATALMSVVLIVFVLLSSIYSLGFELKNSTAQAALRKANNSVIVLVVGKLLPYTIIFFIQALIFNLLIFKYMGMPMTGSYNVLVISELLLILAYQFMGVLILGISGNLRLSISIGSAYSMMALTFSGLTFPGFGMPMLARIFGQLFPLSHWIKVFTGISLRDEPFAVSMVNLLYLFTFILMGCICLYWLKNKYRNELYWGKS